jgi:hypothetical protein
VGRCHCKSSCPQLPIGKWKEDIDGLGNNFLYQKCKEKSTLVLVTKESKKP